MIKAYNCGCHFVDSSFVLHFSNKGQAMVLNSANPTKLPDPSKQPDSSSEEATNDSSSEEATKDFGPSLAENVPSEVTGENEDKKKKKRETGKVLIFKPEHYMPNKSINLDLVSPVYTRQFCKIAENCECFTCQRHTRGYVNHLLITRELLAPTLLMLHNTYHVRNLVNTVKDKVERGDLAKYKETLDEVFKLKDTHS